MYWSEVLKVLLEGVADPDSPLRLLRGHEATILREIYALLWETWKAAVRQTTPAEALHGQRIESPVRALAPRGGPRPYYGEGVHLTDNHTIAWSLIDGTMARRGRHDVSFPPYTGISCNMLPFRLGDIQSLPLEFQPYFDVIQRCRVPADEHGKIYYLTVRENDVAPGATQSRPGLHIECPNPAGSTGFAEGGARWGCGLMRAPDHVLLHSLTFHGGIFMASTVSDSCAIYDSIVEGDLSVIDKHGGMEHLRPLLGPAVHLPADRIVWLTDRTPHEALPQTEGGRRQFFRLVSSDLAVWYSRHSTPNPLVALPESVRVVHEDKFGKKTSQS